VIPATHSAVVMLSNTDFSPIGPLNAQLVQMLMPRNADVPVIAGASALDAAKKFLLDLEKGSIDRSTLGEDFSVFLTPERIAAGRKALSAMGPIANVAIAGVGERGGMEVASVSFTVGGTPARGLMYRTPDGKVQEFLFSRQ